jgi:hypothetical protein
MRKVILLKFILLFLIKFSIAQSPLLFSYQAIARDALGNPIANKKVSLKVSILANINGNVEYSETHFPTTDSDGLINIKIGNGNPSLGTMATVNWANGDKFLKLEIDTNGGNNYTTIGTTQLLSVPYAIFANEIPVRYKVTKPAKAFEVEAGKSFIKSMSGTWIDGEFEDINFKLITAISGLSLSDTKISKAELNASTCFGSICKNISINTSPNTQVGSYKFVIEWSSKHSKPIFDTFSVTIKSSVPPCYTAFGDSITTKKTYTGNLSCTSGFTLNNVNVTIATKLFSTLPPILSNIHYLYTEKLDFVFPSSYFNDPFNPNIDHKISFTQGTGIQNDMNKYDKCKIKAGDILKVASYISTATTSLIVNIH